MSERLHTAGYLRFVYGGFSGVAFLEVPLIFDPGKGGLGLRVFAGAIIAVCAVLTIRGARSATLVVNREGVTYRGLIRTRRWSWQGISAFEAQDTEFGILAWKRRVLFLREQQGAVRKLES